MKSPLARIAAVLVPVLAAAACGGDKKEQVDSDLASLIPADTVAVARIASIDELVQHARDVARTAGEDPSRIDADEMLGELGEMGGRTELIDRKRPIAVAVTLPRGGQPAPVVLVPSTDAKAYAASLPPFGAAPVVAGRYVAVPLGAKYEKPASPSTAMDALPGGAFAMRADVEKLTAAFGKVIDMGLKSVEAMMAQELRNEGNGIDGQALAQVYTGGVRAVLEAAQSLEVSVDYRDGKVDAFAKLTVKPGSEMDGWSSAPVDVSALAARMTGKSPLEVVAVMDMQKLWPRYEAIMDVVLDMYPPDMRGPMRTMIASGREMYGATGASMVGEGDLFGDGGFSMTLHTAATDHAKLQKWIDTAMANEGMAKAGIAVTAAKPVEEKGATVRDFTVKLDPAKLAAMAGDDARSTERATHVMASMFGSELSARLATKGNAATFAIGKQGAAAEALAGVDRTGGSFSKPVQAALARVADCNPLLVERFDCGAILSGVARMMRAAGSPFAPPVPAGLSADLVVSGGIHGTEWRAGFAMDVAGVARMVEAMKPR